MNVKKLVLLIGHNAKAKGAANGETNEYDYNLDLARKICANIAGPSVTPMIFKRRWDLPKDRELAEVVERVNEWGPDLTIELHLNSFDSPAASGTEILIAGNMAANYSADLPERMLDKITTLLGTRNRGEHIIHGPGESGWPIQSNLNGERLLLESFFLSSPDDLAAGIEKKEELAEAIAAVASKYLGDKNG